MVLKVVGVGGASFIVLYIQTSVLVRQANSYAFVKKNRGGGPPVVAKPAGAGGLGGRRCPKV